MFWLNIESKKVATESSRIFKAFIAIELSDRVMSVWHLHKEVLF